MATEELAPVEGDPETVEAPLDDEPQAPRTVEEFARERGWKPKDEYSGDEWRDAETFLSYGMDNTKDLKRSLRTVEDRIERISRTSVQVAQDAAERARREERAHWEGVHSKAVEDGDQGKAFEAVEKIAELRNPAPADPTQRDPLVERFVSENAWFNSDEIAKSVAVAAADVVTRRGGTVAEQLDAAKEAVHKRFPEYAPAPTKAAPTVGQPGSRIATTTSRSKTAADLPRDAREAMNALIKKGLTTEKGYLGHYFDTKGTVE